jgi:hypothetical protein
MWMRPGSSWWISRIFRRNGVDAAERVVGLAADRLHFLRLGREVESQHLVAREMPAEQGVGKLTMDALAQRAGLGKGTVFRRFGTRAGIFQALLDDDERAFQEQVLSGSASDLSEAASRTGARVGQSWQDLVQRVCRP